MAKLVPSCTRHFREETLFADVLVLSLAKRRVFLKRACDGDRRLCQRIEALLKAHKAAGRLLDPPVQTSVTNPNL